MKGDRLKKLRKEKKYNQDKLSKLLGVSRSAISMWEINASEPDSNMLLKISNALDCSVDYLLGKTDKKMPDDEIVIEHKKELIDFLSELTPEQFERVQDFVAGMRASDKDSQSRNQ